MNIDELAHAIRAVSNEKVVQLLADLLIEWKQNQDTAEDLRNTIERYIGNSWIEKHEDHSKIYQMWTFFRDEAILGIGGMAMNERLYWFSLIDEFDACPYQEAKLKIYKKLMASPPNKRFHSRPG